MTKESRGKKRRPQNASVCSKKKLSKERWRDLQMRALEFATSGDLMNKHSKIARIAC